MEIIAKMAAISLLFAGIEVIYANVFSTTFASCACAYSFAIMCWSRMVSLKEISIRGYYLSVGCLIFLSVAELVSYYAIGPEATYFWLKCCYSALFSVIWLASHGI